MSDLDPVAAPPRAKKTAVIAALALVVTFIAGFIIGAVSGRLMHFRRPGPPPVVPHAMLNRLDRQLDLTDQQRAEIGRILRRRHERITAHWQAVQPEIRKEIDATNAEIERHLTPAQREKFQTLRMRLGPRMHRGGKARTEPTR